MKNKFIKMWPYLLIWTSALLIWQIVSYMATGEATWYVGLSFSLFILPITALAVSMSYAGKYGFSLIFPLFIWLLTILTVQLVPVIPDLFSGNTGVLLRPHFLDHSLFMGVSAAISLLGMAIGRTAYPNGLFPEGLLRKK